jgi:hypothetical protein
LNKFSSTENSLLGATASPVLPFRSGRTPGSQTVIWNLLGALEGEYRFLLSGGLISMDPDTKRVILIDIDMHRVLVGIWRSLANGHSIRSRRPLTHKFVMSGERTAIPPRQPISTVPKTITETGRTVPL